MSRTDSVFIYELVLYSHTVRHVISVTAEANVTTLRLLLRLCFFCFGRLLKRRNSAKCNNTNSVQASESRSCRCKEPTTRKSFQLLI